MAKPRLCVSTETWWLDLGQGEQQAKLINISRVGWVRALPPSKKTPTSITSWVLERILRGRSRHLHCMDKKCEFREVKDAKRATHGRLLRLNPQFRILLAFQRSRRLSKLRLSALSASQTHWWELGTGFQTLASCVSSLPKPACCPPAVYLFPFYFPVTLHLLTAFEEPLWPAEMDRWVAPQARAP